MNRQSATTRSTFAALHRFGRLFTLWLCLGPAADAAAQTAASPPVTPAAGQPIPWHQRTLFIPYHLNAQLPAARDIAQVQLLVSRTGRSDWTVLQSAQPNVQGFNYHAPEDGDYWFALKHLDANGRSLDATATVPQLHIVIKTHAGPEIKPPANAIAANLAQPPELPPSTVTTQENAAHTAGPLGLGDPFQAASKPPQDWPATNQLPAVAAHTPNPTIAPASSPPPIINPYTASADTISRRTPAKFAVDGSHDAESGESAGYSSNLLDTKSAPRTAPAQQPPYTSADWSSAGRQNGPVLVNAQTFDVEYDVQVVGTWGIAKVELWGTQDEGASWHNFGVDPDNRSPIRVTVPNSGTFGFRILVEGANSFGIKPPQAGDKPELVVVVDLQPPQVEIEAIEPGAGTVADQLRIGWTAQDTNLDQRPIGLFYSTYAEGPWSTIAAGLENSGSYVWRIERHIPSRFFVRLEARDTAGNVATVQTPEPVVLDRPQPTGTLRAVRPVTDVPIVRPH